MGHVIRDVEVAYEVTTGLAMRILDVIAGMRERPIAD
jgi:hypothetical protein